MRVRAIGVGSSRCDDLARVQRAIGMVQNRANASNRSAPDTARGHRSAMTLPGGSSSATGLSVGRSLAAGGLFLVVVFHAAAHDCFHGWTHLTGVQLHF